MPVQLDTRVAALTGEFTSPEASAPLLMCDRHPREAVAFRFVSASLEETRVTFGELADRSLRMATVLAGYGVQRGDRVATLMGKHVDLPVVMLGIWRLGATYMPLFTAFASSAVADRLDQGDVRVVVTDVEQFSKVPADRVRLVVADDRSTSVPEAGEGLADKIAEALPWRGVAPTGPDIELTHMFTSGTTGKPKTVVHPLSYAAGWQAYLEIGLGVDDEATYWNAADPGWAYGLYAGVIAPMCAGLTNIVTTGKFDADMTWRVLDEFDVTDLAAAPTVFRALRASAERPRLPHLQRLSSAGEPLTPDVFDWALSEWGLQIHDHYGQTELGMPAGFPHHPDAAVDVRPSAMGRSFPGWSMTVLDSTADAPAAVGEVGRLAVVIEESPFFTFTGYGADRANRADRFTEDGRFYVGGDLVAMDEEGLIHFSARDDDVILMAGYRIGPFDVESALATHPAVQECAVVAAPDDMRGEIVHAFVVAALDAPIGQDLVAELQDWVKREYAAHAYPRRIDFVSALPRTPSGKIQRAVLRQGLRADETAAQ